MRTRRNTVRPYPVTRSGVEGLIRPSSIPHGWTARGWRRCRCFRGGVPHRPV